MKEYTDEDIMNIKRITCKIAGDYLGIGPMGVAFGMRTGKLPIGVAVKKEGNSVWSYYIVRERLIAYKNGNLEETIITGIEDMLGKIIENFEQFKEALMILLKKKK